VTSAVALAAAAAGVVWACAPQLAARSAPETAAVRPLLPQAQAAPVQQKSPSPPPERTASAPPPATVADLPEMPREAPTRAELPVDTVMEMRSTAYCLRGSMRTGVRVRDGMAAADPAVLPLGSVVRVSHRDGREIGIFVIMDTGGAVRGNKLDIWLSSCAEARAWGIQRVNAEVIAIGRR
jgi:3D (Asp-Asp-Asp) domain-containing protein